MNISQRYKAMLLVVLLACAANIYGADVTGTIAGVVKDSSGAVVPNVKVVVVDQGTAAKFTATSNDDGSYAIGNLPVGIYNLAAELSGFRKFVSEGIRVQVNETSRIDIALEVGELTQTVEVKALVSTVDTTSATLKTVVDERRVENLPLNGRNPTQLMQLVVGVQADPNANVTSDSTYPGVMPVSVNGGRANTTNYILDGGEANDHYSNAPNPMPNPDALQEFSVQTNNFSAEFGRSLGGIVNAVTRSGTNSLHGSAFEFLRNKALNAANFFSPIDEQGKKQDDGLKRNQFGATLGGPVWLGKLYNGIDRTFFFFSYQGTRLRQTPQRVEQIVPTAAQRSGDFSDIPYPLNNPFTGAVYADNQIPVEDFDLVARTVVDDYLPVPAAGQNTVFFSIPANLNDDQTMIKIDHQVSASNKLSGRFWVSQASMPAFLGPGNYLAITPGHTWRNTSVVLTDVHSFGPSVVNTALFSFNRTNNYNAPIPPAQSLHDLGSNIYSDPIPQLYFEVDGYFELNTQDTNTFLRDEYQVSDALRWSTGRHQISVGGEYGHGLGDINNNYTANGIFAFSGGAPFTGDSLADFFLGKFAAMDQGIGEYKKTRFNILALFAQDSMRVTSRFTVDLGLRWEPFFPYTDAQGKLAAWRPGQQSTRFTNAPEGILYPGDPGLPDGGYNTAWRNFGPRIGFAWDVFGDGKASVRGGYGIFYDRPNTISTNSAANQGPFGTVVTVYGDSSNSLSDPYAGRTNPFPASTTPPPDVQFVLPHVAFVYDSHMRNGYLQAWNFILERSLPGAVVLKAAYAGSKGTHLASLREANPAIYAPGVTTATTDERRPLYPNFGRVTLVEATDNSTFHSLQLTAERRFRSGFSLLANYMFSKTIDMSSQNKQTGQTVTNPFNLSFDKGPAEYDHTHVFSLSSLWALPVHPKGKLAEGVLGGWNLSSIVTLRSGFPFTVYSDVDNARSGTDDQRADLVGNPLLAGSRSRGEQIEMWLDPAAFAPNALGTFGNQGRNMWRGPGFATVDLGIHKEFRVRERLTMQFRFEMFNAFNRVNLQGPEPYEDSGNFMRTTSAFDPRILQFALRLAW